LIRYFGPRLTGIKIPNIIEFSFVELKSQSYFSKKFTDNIALHTNIDKTGVSMFPADASDSYFEIMNSVDDARARVSEVFVVDLREGNVWITPNLYFLAFLVAKRTIIKQFVFVETKQKEKQFVGMCSPNELLSGLGRSFPIYQTGANNITFKGLELLSDGAVTNFTQNLGNVSASAEHKVGVTSALLSRHMKDNLHYEKIEFSGSFSLSDYNYIVTSSNPYIALVKEDQYQNLINKADVALSVASAMLRKSS
jgi:hypothetical protein